MKVELAPSDVIAEREYRLVGKDRKRRKVVLRLGKPRPYPEGGSAYCVYQLTGMEGGDRTFYAAGNDGVQALHLAMHVAATDLITSRAYQEGRLTFEGSFDLFLPVPSVIAHLVKTDPPRRKRLRKKG